MVLRICSVLVLEGKHNVRGDECSRVLWFIARDGSWVIYIAMYTYSLLPFFQVAFYVVRRCIELTPTIPLYSI